MLSRLTRPMLLPYWWQDLLVCIPRVFCGFFLSFSFGAAKFGLPWSPPENNLKLFEVAFWFPNDIAELGGIFSFFPAVWAWLGAFSEGVGGLAFLLGFQTRLFSLLLMVTMFVAAFVQHAHQGLWQQLPAVGFLWVNLFTAILGGGRFSTDFLITKKTFK